jgi:hypothetical protein
LTFEGASAVVAKDYILAGIIKPKSRSGNSEHATKRRFRRNESAIELIILDEETKDELRTDRAADYSKYFSD